MTMNVITSYRLPLHMKCFTSLEKISVDGGAPFDEGLWLAQLLGQPHETVH
jgi:hypothetical protein